MHRRHFLSASLAASTFALGGEALPQPTTAFRDFYLLRRYSLRMGPQTTLAENYLGSALIPALNRMRLGPIGAFKLDIGPETPAFYLLIPSAAPNTLVSLDANLAQDADFLKAADSFWAAPATAPPFERVDSTLLHAFEGWPKLTVPASSATRAKRIFQLRTYESPTDAAHLRKVEMFHHGEFQIFERTGLHPVFFSQTVIGARMPSLTYMLTFADMAELQANWATFSADPAWKQLSTSPRYSEPIVSNISNQILSPLSASQI